MPRNDRFLSLELNTATGGVGGIFMRWKPYMVVRGGPGGPEEGKRDEAAQ